MPTPPQSDFGVFTSPEPQPVATPTSAPFYSQLAAYGDTLNPFSSSSARRHPTYTSYDAEEVNESNNIQPAPSVKYEHSFGDFNTIHWGSLPTPNEFSGFSTHQHHQQDQLFHGSTLQVKLPPPGGHYGPP